MLPLPVAAGALGALLAATAADAQVRCDVDADGAVTDTDLVNVLRAATGRSNRCTPALCDTDGDGNVGAVDVRAALRAAGRLSSPCLGISSLVAGTQGGREEPPSGASDVVLGELRIGVAPVPGPSAPRTISGVAGATDAMANRTIGYATPYDLGTGAAQNGSGDPALVVAARRADGTRVDDYYEVPLGGTSRTDALAGVTFSPALGREPFMLDFATRADGVVSDYVEIGVAPVPPPSRALALAETQRSGLPQRSLGRSLVLSPNGRHLYVAASNTVGQPVAEVREYGRDSSTGRLTFLRNAPAEPWPGQTLVASPDGRNVYLGGNGTVQAYDRDAATGALSFVELTLSSPPGDSNEKPSLVIDPSGRHLYGLALQTPLGADDTFAIHIYVRNQTTGRLTEAEPFIPAITGDPFLGLANLIISPDGRHLYVTFFFGGAGSAGGRLVALARNDVTGALSVVDQNALAGTGFLPTSLAVTPDGTHVHTGGLGGVRTLARNATTGALQLAHELVSADAGTTTSNFDDVALSPDGTRVYYAGPDRFTGALSVFARAPDSGVLTFLAAQFERVNGVEGIARTDAIATSADGAHVYVMGDTERGAFVDPVLSTFRVIP